MASRANLKQAAIDMIRRLPDDVTLEDIMYELYFRQHVDEGLRDIEEGRTVPHEEVKRSLAEWLRPAGR